MALEDFAPDSIIHTAVVKPEVEIFVEESTQRRIKILKPVVLI